MLPESKRQFDRGIVAKDTFGRFYQAGSVPNSVQFAYNADFDEVIGAIACRNGSSIVGAAISGATDILGINAIRTATSNIEMTVVNDGANADMYYLNSGTWTASTGWVNKTANKHRFAQLNGWMFVCNGADAMMASSDGASWVTTNCPTGITPSYVIQYRGQLLVATNTRVYFSSVVDPGSDPFITWDTVNDWFDVNPDDGGYITGFARVGNVLVVMKNNGMYRVDLVAEAITPDDIYDRGSTTQETMTVCQGVLYFYSGSTVYITDGSAYPQQISRPIQAILRQISSDDDVYMTSDENNVYLDIGNITYRGESYSNVVLRYSTRTSSWAFFGYPYRMKHGFFNDKEFYVLGGSVGSIYKFGTQDTTDNGTSIPYSATLQVIDGNIPTITKTLEDEIFVYTRDAIGSEVEIVDEKGNKDKITIDGSTASERIKNARTSKEFTVTWQGVRDGKLPVFEGIDIPYTSKGVRNK